MLVGAVFVNVRYPALAAIVLCATMRAETPEPASGSLDAAKRDLRELPAAERSREILGKSSGSGSADLPALTLPGSGDASQSKPEPNAAPSPTWLQDALKQTDAERDQRRQSPDAALARDQANGYKPVRAPDPLAQYLGQWMTPRDRELLRPEAKNSADQKTTGPLDLNASSLEGPGVSTSPPDAASVSTLELAKNPYLPEPETPLPAPSPFAPAAATSAQSGEHSHTSASLPMVAPSNLNTAPGSATPAPSPLEPAVIPPTAPIVDDRKYFPQLHRF